MKHAFLIMAYNNWNQLKTLFRLLDDSRNSIYLHVDASSQGFNPSDFSGLLHRASLKLIPRMRVTWGSTSQIICEINLLEHALAGKSDYYHLLSGMDLPLHSMDYIDDFFFIHRGMEFVHFSEQGETLSAETRNRIALWHPFQNQFGKHNKFIEYVSFGVQRLLHVDRLKKVTLDFGKGANWFSITNDFAQFIVNNWLKFQDFFFSSLCADEMFIQTILLNSPYRHNIFHSAVDDDYAAIMRLIDWKRGQPYVFRLSDYHELVNSQMLFARKFDERIDSYIIDMLSRHICSSSDSFITKKK